MTCNGYANLFRQRLLAWSSASIPKLHRTLRINIKTQVLSCCADTQHNYDGKLLWKTSARKKPYHLLGCIEDARKHLQLIKWIVNECIPKMPGFKILTLRSISTANDYLALLRLAPRIVHLYREGRFELAEESLQRLTQLAKSGFSPKESA